MKDKKEKSNPDQSDKDNFSENVSDELNYKSQIKRGSLPKKGFFDNLTEKVEEIKHHGIELGKIAAREAEEIGEKIDDAVDEGWDAASKKLNPKQHESSNEIIDVLERLAKLKEQGIITEKEFNLKKKDLLEKI